MESLQPSPCQVCGHLCDVVLSLPVWLLLCGECYEAVNGEFVGDVP
jgi:hypothetical protein